MNTFKPYGRRFWATVLLIVLAVTASAQEFRGSLAGKILDPNGAVPYSVANLSITKNFHISESKRIQIRAEALNAFNHPYFGAGMGLNPGTAAAPNAAFGLVTTQRNNPRDIQIGAKFIF